MDVVEIAPRTLVEVDGTQIAYDDLFVPRRCAFKRRHKFRDGRRYWKRLKQIVTAEDTTVSPTPKYAAVEAGASVYPAKKYCDLTGLPARYVDPRTKLRYANEALFAVVRSLPDDVVQSCLAIRNAHVVLR